MAGLGKLALSFGDFKLAYELFAQAQTVGAKARVSEAWLLSNAIELEAAHWGVHGNVAHSIPRVSEIERRGLARGNLPLVAYCEAVLGTIAFQTGDLARAEQHELAALRYARLRGDRHREGLTWVNLGFIAHSRDDRVRAALDYAVACAVAEPHALASDMARASVLNLSPGSSLDDFEDLVDAVRPHYEADGGEALVVERTSGNIRDDAAHVRAAQALLGI
jgi:hypothetical protein